MKKVILFGITEMSKVICEFIDNTGIDKVVAFTADNKFVNGKTSFNKLPLFAFEEIEKHYPPNEHYFLTIRSTQSATKHVSEKKFREIEEKGYSFYSYIDPQAYIAKSAQIGVNCIVCPTAVIEPFATIEDGVFVRSGVYISHHTKIGAHTYLAPRVAFSGNIVVGKNCFIGTNATIRDKVKIGNDSIVGAGAVVLKDLPQKSVYKAAVGSILPIDRYKIKP